MMPELSWLEIHLMFLRGNGFGDDGEVIKTVKARLREVLKEGRVSKLKRGER